METFSRGTLEPQWLTGFAQAAGSFTYSRSGKQLALYFSVRAPAVDCGLMEDVQRFFGGAGRIYGVADGRSVYYRVTHRLELNAVVEHFDAYPLRSHKAAAYAVWREMVELKQQFRSPDRGKLEELADRLSEVTGSG